MRSKKEEQRTHSREASIELLPHVVKLPSTSRSQNPRKDKEAGQAVLETEGKKQEEEEEEGFLIFAFRRFVFVSIRNAALSNFKK